MDDYSNNYFLMLMLDTEEEYNDFIEGLTNYLSTHPNNAIALNNRGLAYSEIGMKDRALQDLKQSLKLNPNSIYPYRNIAYILTQQNKFDLALEYYTNALELKEQEHILYKLRGKCYEKLGRDFDAKLDYELATKLQG